MLNPLLITDYERLNLEETGTATIERGHNMVYGDECVVGSKWVNAVVAGSVEIDNGYLITLVAVRSGRE